MSRKRKNTSFDKRQFVIYCKKKGKTYYKIAELLRMKKVTVADVIKKYKEDKHIEFTKQIGRP